MSENGKENETRARLSDEVAKAVREAQPLLERRLGIGMTQTKLLDYLLIRGLAFVGLGRLVAHLWDGAESHDAPDAPIAPTTDLNDPRR